MSLLHGIEEAGFGALFFGLFEHESAVKDRFGVPDAMRALGSIAMGRPTAAQRPSESAKRARAPIGDVVHMGRWRSAEPND